MFDSDWQKTNTVITTTNNTLSNGNFWMVVEKYDNVIQMIDKDYKIEVHDIDNDNRITLYRSHIVSVEEIKHGD